MSSIEFVTVSRLLFELISITQGFFFFCLKFLSRSLEYEKCFVDAKKEYDTKEILLLTSCFVKTVLPFSLGITRGKLKSPEHSNIMQIV